MIVGLPCGLYLWFN